MARKTVEATDPIPSGECRLQYTYPYGAGYVGLVGTSFEPDDEFDCTPEVAAILLAQEGNFVLISGTPAELLAPVVEEPTGDPAPIEVTPVVDPTTMTDPTPTTDPALAADVPAVPAN